MTHRQSLLFVLEAKYWSVWSLFCLVIGLLFSLFVEGLNFFAKSYLLNANVKTEQMLWTMLFFYGWIMECLCVFVFETTKQRAKGSFAVFVTVRSPKSCCTLQRDSGTHRIPLSLLWCKDQCNAEICCKWSSGTPYWHECEIGSRNGSVDPKEADRQAVVNAYLTSSGLFFVGVRRYLI